MWKHEEERHLVDANGKRLDGKNEEKSIFESGVSCFNPEHEKLQRLSKHQEEYIQLLQGELEEVVPIAAIHGWKSSITAIDEGIRLRNAIREISK